MTAIATPLPFVRTELVIRPVGGTGQYVVKNPKSGAFFQLGSEEHFLLLRLDGNC